MKIKTVCDITGLTDRTVRYYIEEQLIAPAYTENYLGRKSFDFSQTDINTLKNISVLRKFDFTIGEIRDIINDANASSTIIANVRYRTENAVSIGEEKLLVLSTLSNERIYTLGQLAEELSKPIVELPEHKEIIKRDIRKIILPMTKTVLTFMIVWIPIALSLFAVMVSINHFYYPVFNPVMIVFAILSFWPSAGVLILAKTKWQNEKKFRRVLLVLCILCLPVNFVLSCRITTRSETTDFKNYRDFDADCILNRSQFFQELFPIWPYYFSNEKQPNGSWETVYLNAHYLYRMLPAMDYTYDVYAQWPLEKEEFDKEVSRVQALYDNQTGDYDIVQKENFTCFFRYDGDPPFEKVTDSYTYYIFAYDEKNLIVRYVACVSLENGVDQPFYLSLDW